MTQYLTIKDGIMHPIQTPYSSFKQFRKEVNRITSDGFSAVYQKIPETTAVVSKMSFLFDETTGQDVVDIDSIGRFVYIHQEIIRQTMPRGTMDLTCFVMTHENAEVPAGYLEEIYFVFPNIQIASNELLKTLVPNVREFLRGSGFHTLMELVPINSLESIISDDIHLSGMFPMPGSYINGSLLSITHVFDTITTENVNDGVINVFPTDAYFSNFEIPDKEEYGFDNSFFFTNLNGFEVVKKKKTRHEKNRDLAQHMIDQRTHEIKRTPLDECALFMSMFLPARFANEVNRNKVGQVVFNVVRGEEEGLKLWKDTIKSKIRIYNNPPPVAQFDQFGQAVQTVQAEPKMSEGDLEKLLVDICEQCDELWDFMEYTESTVGTLRYWAKEDSPEKYASFLKKDVTTLAWKCLNVTSGHHDVARLVYAMYSNQFACSGIKDKSWYGFWRHRWHLLDSGHALRLKLSEEVAPLFDKILDECSSEFKKAIGDEEKEKWSKMMNACSKMVKDLKNVPYKNNIMSSSADLFYDDQFVNKLDENREIIGCPNGVYELDTGIFRPGKPEDFITLSTKVKYNPNYSWEHAKVKQVMYYMMTVYPDKELRNYVLKAFGTILEGGNMNKDFYNMIGEGDNSKSMVAKLIKLCLGSYVSKIPVAVIMGKRGNAGNATPNLADKKGIRALMIEEPPKGRSNVSVVKELSGNDDIIARALFKNPVVFSPQWKLFVWTNNLMEAPADEKAYWNRQKVIDHESLFTFDAPESVEEQFQQKKFPRDPFFDRKLKAMAEAFLWCMIQWYNQFKEEGLIPPERVVKATAAAKLRNDIYMQYMMNALTHGSVDDSVTVDQMYADFTEWYGRSFLGNVPCDKFDFRDQMSKHGHLGQRPIGDKWSGIKFKQSVVTLPQTGMGAMRTGFGTPGQQTGIGRAPGRLIVSAAH